jgi:hypothetical protein
MRKAARKQKKIQKVRDPLIVTPLGELDVFIDKHELLKNSGRSDNTMLVADEDFQNFADEISTNKTISKLILTTNAKFFSLIAEALKTNTSVKFFQLTQSKKNEQDTFNYTYKMFDSLAIIFLANRITSLHIPLQNRDWYWTSNHDSFIAFVQELQKNTSLTSITIPQFGDIAKLEESLIEAIITHPSLVDVRYNCIWELNQSEIPPLLKLLAANRIHQLQMKNFGIPAHRSSFEPILKALEENTSLTDLIFSGFDSRKQQTLSDEDLELLGKVLRINQKITKLDINGNNLNSCHMSKIFESLNHNKSLTQLDFWKNNLNSDIGPSLGVLLQVNESLTELDLSSSQLNDDTCQIIGPALKHNKSLTFLNLFNNFITSEGCKYLAEGIKCNKTLIRLDLKECKLDDKGCKYFGEAIKTNPCLLRLDISGPDIRTPGFKELIDGMKENESLTELTVSKAKSVPKELQEQILELQKKNKLFQRDLIVNTITMLIQIARSDAFDQFPLEIWLRIFKHFVCGGVPGFNHIAESILMHSDVRDVKSLCQMKIVRINGKSHLARVNKNEFA